MSLPVLSIIALAVAIVISCVSRLNVGLLSIALAFLVGVVFGRMSVAEVMAGFPSGLFLTLTGVRSGGQVFADWASAFEKLAVS